jgi:peptide/nickel transport system permease protein
VLPTLTLALGFLAIYLRIMRASMLEVLTLDFVRTARAKGLPEYGVVSATCCATRCCRWSRLIGLQAGTMLGGSVVVESVFALPGLGRLAYESVVQRDLNTCSASSSSRPCWSLPSTSSSTSPTRDSIPALVPGGSRA